MEENKPISVSEALEKHIANKRKNLDLSPSWSRLLLPMLALLKQKDIDVATVTYIRGEFRKMAQAADSYNEDRKRLDVVFKKLSDISKEHRDNEDAPHTMKHDLAHAINMLDNILNR